jgi:hypothetical protein
MVPRQMQTMWSSFKTVFDKPHNPRINWFTIQLSSLILKWNATFVYAVVIPGPIVQIQTSVVPNDALTVGAVVRIGTDRVIKC